MAKLLYFGALVDQLSKGSEVLELPAETKTVSDLLALLRARGGAWEKACGADAVRVTVNKQFAEQDTSIKNGDEIALISARM